MNVKDIPDDMMQEIRLRFESTPEVRSLRTRQEYAQRQGRYMEALQLAETAERLFPAVLNEYMAWAEREMVTFDTGSEDLPQKDRDEMMEKLMVLFMALRTLLSTVTEGIILSWSFNFSFHAFCLRASPNNPLRTGHCLRTADSIAPCPAWRMSSSCSRIFRRYAFCSPALARKYTASSAGRVQILPHRLWYRKFGNICRLPQAVHDSCHSGYCRELSNCCFSRRT